VTKRKTSKKRGSRQQAVRDGQRPGIPGWIWLAIGMLMGLGLAVFLMLAGLMPRQPEGADRPVPRPDATPVTGTTVEDLSQPGAGEEDEWKPKYDFYTVLPEMEVVVPEKELAERIERREQQAADRGPYQIQVGSFRQFGDADRIKAQLALLGISAQIKEVSINESSWHRVRVGPFDSVREMDRVKQQLENAGHEVLVLRERP
jgi:cell division protein FtsN